MPESQEIAKASAARKDKFVAEMTALLKQKATLDTAKEAVTLLKNELLTAEQKIGEIEFIISKLSQDLIAQLETK